MRVDELSPTQDGFRLPIEARRRMMEFVRQGGCFDRASIESHAGASRLIAIDRFADGRCFVRDGIHRVASIYVARPDRCLRQCEYTLTDRAYSIYMEVDLADGWYTPFDPRTEVRLADFMSFKLRVLEHLRQGSDPTDFIRQHRWLYCRRRTRFDTFEQLARQWTPSLKNIPPWIAVRD